MAKDSWIAATFTVERNDRIFVVQFMPIHSSWWNVAIKERGKTIHSTRKNFPPNFTNAGKSLDDVVIEKKIKRHKFKVVG